MTAFEDVKRVSIFNGRAITDEVGKIKDTLSKSSNDWKVRIDTHFVVLYYDLLTMNVNR